MESRITLYRYGMEHPRGFDIGCQPKEGFYAHYKSDKYYDEISYTRKLTKAEQYTYDLKFIKKEVI